MIIFVIVVSVAYFNLTAIDSEPTELYTGTLITDFKDGVEINNPKFIPRYEPESLIDVTNTYTNQFVVENTGTLDQTFDVYLDVLTNEFKDGSLKYKVFNSKGNSIKEGNIVPAGDMKLLQNTYLKSSDSASYTLVIWMQENNLNQDDEQAKALNGFMRVESVQTRK
ncbi:MAG: hypothetical protein IJH34_14090 [Romboutsia sp.]|nr:hypothetical protein [Romboutsia sp.]